MAIQFVNGQILFNAGQVAMDAGCCCGTTPTTTTGLQCAGGTEPSMVLTVSGASGTINWCGETWNLPTDSGVSKQVCPTTYRKEKGSGTAGGQVTWHGSQIWTHAPGNDLFLRRGYAVYRNYLDTLWIALVTPEHLWGNELFVKGIGDARWAAGQAANRPVPLAWTNIMYSYLNMIMTVPIAAYNTYQLTNEFFGSYVLGGITYTWSKGTNW